MKLPGFVSRAMSLREAAAVIFVLVALLPLLLFVAVISASGLISKTEAQFDDNMRSLSVAITKEDEAFSRAVPLA